MKTELNYLSGGEYVTVIGITGLGERELYRLEDLGVCEGEKICCVMKSPTGGCCAYRIKGSVIALRHNIARHITVEKGDVQQTLSPAAYKGEAAR